MMIFAIIGAAICWLLCVCFIGGAAQDSFPELFNPPGNRDDESEK